MEQHLKFKYQKVVADAGYEGEENYPYQYNLKSFYYLEDFDTICRNTSCIVDWRGLLSCSK